MARSKVAALKVTPQTVLEDIQRGCDLAELSGALASGSATLIHSTVQYLPAPGVGTTPWQLEGAVRALRQNGHNDLVCLQDRIFDENDAGGYLALLRRLRAPVRSFHDPLDTVRINYRPKARLLSLHQLFPGGLTIPEVFLGKNMVHLPTLRGHPHTAVAGAAYSALSGLLGNRAHLPATAWHPALVDALTIQKEIHSGLFTLMDGTSVCCSTKSDPKRAPLLKNIILASADPVAIDAVAVKLMSIDPLEVPYIKLAHSAGLGTGDPRDIDLVGDDVTSESWSFQLQPAANNPWRRALGRGRQLLLRSPLADTIGASKAFVRDHYHWPRHERAVFETWKRETHWGQLFASYEVGRSSQ
jgi:uncharacterized protein (DUF362 family)